MNSERFHRFLNQQFKDLCDLVEAEHDREVARFGREVARLERELTRLRAEEGALAVIPAPSPAPFAAPPPAQSPDQLKQDALDDAECSLASNPGGSAPGGAPQQQRLSVVPAADGRARAAQASRSGEQSEGSSSSSDSERGWGGSPPALRISPAPEQGQAPRPQGQHPSLAAAGAAVVAALTLKVPGQANCSASCSGLDSEGEGATQGRSRNRHESLLSSCSRNSCRRLSFSGNLPLVRSESVRQSQWSMDSDDATFYVLQAWEDSSWRKSRAKLVRSSMVAQDEADITQGWDNVVLGKLRSSSSMTDEAFESVGHDAEAQDLRRSRVLRFLNVLQPFIMAPGSKFHAVWEALVFVFILYDVVVIPLGTFQLEPSPARAALSWVACLFWTADIVLSGLLTGVLDREGRVVLIPAEVARRRLVSMRLPFDVICCSADWTRAGAPGAVGDGPGRVLGYLRLLRGLKLYRLAKAGDIKVMITEHLRNENMALIVEISSDIVMMLIIAHLFACVWYGIGWADDGGWVENHDIRGAGFWDNYLVSLHWSIAHFTGEIIIAPQTLQERMFSIFTLFFTFLTVSLFVSSITSSLNERSLISSKQSSQLVSLRRYLRDRAISTSLAVRVQRNAQNALEERKRNAPESSVELLAMISEPLRVELHFEVRSPMLLAHAFFEHYYAINPQGIQKLCHSAISHQPLSKADVAFTNLETPTHPRMYFITGGSMLYLQEASVAQQVRDGHWAAEASLWTKWIHCGTLRAVTECTLVVLSAEKFQLIASPFPTCHAQLYAAAFVRILNDQDKGSLTDLSHGDYEGAIAEAFPELVRTSGVEHDETRNSWKLRRSKSIGFN